MAETRDKNQWARTSQMLCVMANGLLKKKSGGMFKPGDFNPYRKKSKPAKLDPVEAVMLLAKLMGGK